MKLPTPFFRESGSGPGVVCLHCNASSSTQWRGLMEDLAPHFHILAADGYGAGKGPVWPPATLISISNEADLLEPIFERAGTHCMLVAHSHGAAVALIAALKQPERIRAMVVYEPTLFSLIDAQSPAPNEADGIRDAVSQAGAALDAADPDHAARCFIDFWMGAGAWDSTPEARKGPIKSSIVNVRGWGNALFSEPTPLQDFTALTMPILYLVGKNSPIAAKGVASLLTKTLPNVEVVEFEGLGHMGPITHPEVVNPVIARFLTKLIV